VRCAVEPQAHLLLSTAGACHAVLLASYFHSSTRLSTHLVHSQRSGGRVVEYDTPAALLANPSSAFAALVRESHSHDRTHGAQLPR